MVAIYRTICVGIYITIGIARIDVRIIAIAIKIYITLKVFKYLIVVFNATQIDCGINLCPAFKKNKLLTSRLYFCCQLTDIKVRSKFVDREGACIGINIITLCFWIKGAVGFKCASVACIHIGVEMVAS